MANVNPALEAMIAETEQAIKTDADEWAIRINAVTLDLQNAVKALSHAGKVKRDLEDRLANMEKDALASDARLGKKLVGLLKQRK